MKSGRRYSKEECNEFIEDVISQLCTHASEMFETTLDSNNQMANLLGPVVETRTSNPAAAPCNSGATRTALPITQGTRRGGRGSIGRGRSGGWTDLMASQDIVLVIEDTPKNRCMVAGATNLTAYQPPVLPRLQNPSRKTADYSWE